MVAEKGTATTASIEGQHGKPATILMAVYQASTSGM